MTREDSEFRKKFEASAPAVYDMVSPYLIDDHSETTGSSHEFDGFNLAALKSELDDIESRIESAASKGVTFTKEEVSAIKHKVEDKLAQITKGSEAKDEAPKDAKSTAKTEASAQQSDAEDEEEEEKEPEPTTEKKKATISRGKLDAIQRRARGLKAKADQSAAQQIKDMETELRKDLEVVLAHDLGSLDEEGLRRRVVQLVLELKDRNRWEAMRMYELTKQHTDDVVKKYDELLRDQSERYEDLIRAEAADAASRASDAADQRAEEHFSRVIFNKEQQWHRNTQEALERQRAELARDMEQKFAQAKAQLESKASEDIASRVKALGALKDKVKSLQSALQKRSDNEQLARNLRQMSLAVLEAQDALYKRPQEVGFALQKLKAAAGGDQSIESSLSALSPRILHSGVADELDLLQRFESVYDECYKVALVPDENAGIVEYAVARAVAALTFRRSDAPASSEDQEFHLTRARALLREKHDLAASLKEMECLRGLVKNTASDWVAEAKDRVAVEQALVLVKSHLSVLSASLSK
ncbi:MICOS complex subunit mic60 [Hondaea fermentalgiana]|uniref:MICOS complex subunit mic60 n=1 Tax=Hondaea fermentalgiana TaxID=2315210 RepID=A0A2R5G863_9STRA|nr:MICOS complex subunit mic60 [Hondaea fermentalgiana]|eukprot:GBG25978.1 MICOS complex subunit mic60 [Hondaea fermentalgiana]